MHKDILGSASVSTAGVERGLQNATNLNDYIADYEAAFDDGNFYALLGDLIARSGKSKARIAADSCLSEPYLYNLIKGEKHPARDTVVKLSFGLHLSIETTERLMKLAGYSSFYVRHKRDAILKFAIMHSFSLIEANDVLVKHDYSILSE